MAMSNSFYGGRRGASFVIVKNYLDIPSMTKDFKNGNSFKDVAFDEYVLINNPNKNHPDNGKIFRRGYDYNSNRKIEAHSNASGPAVEIEAHGAEYIGTIIGPAGKAPLLTMGAYDEVKDLADSAFDERRSKGHYSPIEDTQRIQQEQEETNEWREGPELNNDTISLVPGKYENNGQIKYNDSIEWCCVSVRNDDNGDDTQAYIGFKFPYLVTQLQASWIEPYDGNGNKYNASTIFPISRAEDDDGTHPYYNKWHLNIPKGVKGDTFKNLKVTTYSNWLSSLGNSGQRVMYNVDSSVYSPAAADINRQILIYEDWNYDDKQAGQVTYYYLGDYNQVDNMTLEDGIFTITFTHDDAKTFTFDYVKDVKINNQGYLQFDYSLSGKTKDFPNIKWIKDIQLDTSTKIQPQQGDPYWVINPQSTGGFKIIYNDDSEQEWKLPMVSSINYNNDNGELSYSVLTDNLDLGSEEIAQQRILTTVKYIRSIMQEQMSGVIFIIYNTIRQNASTVEDLLTTLLENYKVGEGEQETDENNRGALRVIATAIGDHEYSVCPIKAITSITMEGSNIVAKYTVGDPVIVGQNIYGIKRFDFDPETSSLMIQKSYESSPTSYPFIYPTSIEYNNEESELEYTLSNGNTSPVGKIPLIKDLSISDSLDFYVQMNGAADADNFITESEEAKQNASKYYDANHPKTQNWVHLGNLAKITNVIGVARNFTWEQLKNIINDNPTLNSDSRLELFRTSIFTIYTEADAMDVVIIALNVLYPNGEITDLDQVDGARYRAVTVGNSEDLKDFYAYDWGANSWFFLGRIETAKNTAVNYKSDVGGLPSSGGILLTKTKDICNITISEDNNLQVKNKMKEIQLGKPYYNYVYNIDATNLNLEIIMNDTQVSTTVFNENTRQINIGEVTGDIIIRKTS